MAKEKEAIFEERIYTIPLRREWLKQTRVQRANRAVSAIRTFLERHMKAAEVKVSPKVNDLIWDHGIHFPPAKVKIKARKDKDGIVTARLPEEVEIKPEGKKKGEKPAPKLESGLTPKQEFEKVEAEKAVAEVPGEETKSEGKEEKKPEEKAKEEKPAEKAEEEKK